MKEHPSDTERAKQVETIGDSTTRESTTATVIIHDRTITSSQLDTLTTSKGDNISSISDTLNENNTMSSSLTSTSSSSSSTETTTRTASTMKSKTTKSSTTQPNSKKIAQEILSPKATNITASIPPHASASQRNLFIKIQQQLEKNRRPRNNKNKWNSDGSRKINSDNKSHNIKTNLFSSKNNKKSRKNNIPSYRPDPQNIERLSYDEALRHRSLWDNKHSKKRDLDSSVYDHPFLADTSTAWDWWQQAYRMLGGYIDCDHAKSEGDDKDGGDGDGEGCSRWMIWAAYVDPNYEGGGRDEYMGDDATGVLDCHTDGTDWKLIGVYRQEFYQYIEQISKHLWAFGDWEYIATCASLAYMTDYDCFQVSYTDDGSYIYAGVQPTSGGYFQMALYTDENCLYPQSLGITYDDMGYQSDLELDEHHSGDDGNYDDDEFLNQASEWWYNAQEYTLSDVNQIFDDYKKCTLCMDYPTYQDGFYNGDTGYDEDDLINQCWKFYSHDTYTCETDCLSLATAQGSITAINYGNYKFGGDFVESSKEYSSQTATTSYQNDGVSETEKLKANAFLTLTGIMFIATFLAFGIARGSISGKSRKTGSSSNRRGDDEDEDRERRKRRSRSRGGDARSTRSKSKSSGRHRSKSNSRRLLNDDYDYEEERSRSSRKRRSSSRKSKSRDDARSSSKRSGSRSGERKSSSGRNRSRSGGGSSVRRSTSRSRERGYYEPPETSGAAAPEPFSSNATASSRRSRRNRAAESSEADRERRYRDDF